MVAPRTNNIVGGHPEQFGKRHERLSEYIVLDAGDHLSLYCVMCHRELFNRCGGFFKQYPFGLFEDQEFAARMQVNGFKQAITKMSWIHHDGACTIEELWRQRPETRGIMEEENRARCAEDMKKLL